MQYGLNKFRLHCKKIITLDCLLCRPPRFSSLNRLSLSYLNSSGVILRQSISVSFSLSRAELHGRLPWRVAAFFNLSKMSSHFQTYSFAEIFGSQVVATNDSKNFVQKSVAVAVGTIAYVRLLFPAKWFHLVDIAGVKDALFNRKTSGPAGDLSTILCPENVSDVAFHAAQKFVAYNFKP